MKTINYAKLSIALIIVVALLRFAFALSHSVSGDACWHLAAARFIATHNKIPLYEGLGRLQPFWAPPAFHIISAIVYKASRLISIDFAEISIKLVSPIFGTLAILFSFLLIRKLFDDKTTFHSMLFLNFIPIFLDYGIFSYTDSMTAFFSLLAVYLMYSNRYIFSSLSFGIAILSKYNAVIMAPMLLYIAYRRNNNKKERKRRMLMIAAAPLLISSPWFIRNYIILGNPIWPYLNGVFKGVNIGTYFNTYNLKPIFSASTYLRSYFELFGLPNGNLSLITFYNFPFMNLILFAWILSTVLFILPFIAGLFRSIAESTEQKYFFQGIRILFASNLIMLFIYLINTGWFGARLLLPMVPFMGIVWAKGLNGTKISKAYLLVFLFISMGFVIAEAVKIGIAAREWGMYKQDFEWARSNTKESSIFYGNGQCLPYNINRLVIDHTAPLDLIKLDYVWVNANWRIDFAMNKDSLGKIKNSDKLKAVYNNPDTGTTIYKIKQ